MQSLLYCQGPVTIAADNSFMKSLLYCQGPVIIAEDNSMMQSLFYCQGPVITASCNQGPVTIAADNSFMKSLLYCQGPVTIAADNSFMQSRASNNCSRQQLHEITFIPFTHNLPLFFGLEKMPSATYIHIAFRLILSWMQAL